LSVLRSAWALFSRCDILCIISGYRKHSVLLKRLGIHMRTSFLLAAAALLVVLSANSNAAFAQANPNQATADLIRDAINPYAATAKPAAPAPAQTAKKSKKKK
jgi:hypothetical protein